VVFEELLVNALIHRDYLVSAPIRLFIFDNRIEIVSPGHLPDNLTVEKIRAGNSNIRNPILVSHIAKGLLPYRGLASGIQRALEAGGRIQPRAGGPILGHGTDGADRRFQVLFAICVLQSQEIEQVGIAKNQIWREFLFLTQGLQFLASQICGFSGQHRPLIEHPIDFGLQSARAPALDSAHLSIKLAPERIFEVDNLFEVCPAQLSPQCGDNLFVWKHLDETNHVPQAFNDGIAIQNLTADATEPRE
jgi:hypothetical protein